MSTDYTRVVRINRTDKRAPRCVECRGDWSKRPAAAYAPATRGNGKPVREGGWDGAAWCEKHLPKGATIVEEDGAMTTRDDDGGAGASADWRIAAGVPRRACVDKLTPAETAIRNAMLAVERAGCDVRLTRAVVLLGQARDLVADYVDGKESTLAAKSTEGFSEDGHIEASIAKTEANAPFEARVRELEAALRDAGFVDVALHAAAKLESSYLRGEIEARHEFDELIGARDRIQAWKNRAAALVFGGDAASAIEKDAGSACSYDEHRK